MHGQNHDRSAAIPTEFKRWETAYLRARNARAASTRINAMYDAVKLVLGPTAGAQCPAAWERAWRSYCDTLEAISRARGFDRHPHRTRGAANDH